MKLQGHGGGEVLDHAEESIGEPGEPAHAHPHREVLTLGASTARQTRAQ
jgi:hypothetical protein